MVAQLGHCPVRTHHTRTMLYQDTMIRTLVSQLGHHGQYTTRLGLSLEHTGPVLLGHFAGHHVSLVRLQQCHLIICIFPFGPPSLPPPSLLPSLLPTSVLETAAEGGICHLLAAPHSPVRCPLRCCGLSCDVVCIFLHCCGFGSNRRK